jgi:hypothetical protein
LEKKSREITRTYKKGWVSPPFIVQNNQGVLWVSDGNHRLEAFFREGIKEHWIIIWNNEPSN